MKTKQVCALVIAATLLTALTAMSMTTMQDAEAKPGKKVNAKCNNIKVQVKVSGVEEGNTVVATVVLDGGVKSKLGVVEENETSITLPVNFKKLTPCPGIDSPITGNVNGTAFDSTLKSLKKPNVVKVNLS